MKKGILKSLWLASLALMGCQQLESDGISKPISITESGTGSTLRTTTPALIQKIDAVDLKLVLMLNGTEQTYLGSDFEDGIWSVDVTLEPNKTHDIVVQWYALDLLLLEESGTFFSNPGNPTLSPELDFTSAGDSRFDNDCDGFSNLDELRSDTDPLVAEGSLFSSCELNTNADSSIIYPNIIRQHKTVAAMGFDEIINSFSQHTLIKQLDTQIKAGAEIVFVMEAESSGVRNNATIRLINHPSDGRTIQFYILRALSGSYDDDSDTACRPRLDNPDFQGIVCTIAYEWLNDRWYDLRLERLDDGVWQAIVVDLATNTPTVIGTINVGEVVQWYRPQFSLRNFNPIPNTECVNGLPQVTAHHRLPVINNTIRWESQRLFRPTCVTAGSGWKEGIRTVDGELLYSLTLGQD